MTRFNLQSLLFALVLLILVLIGKSEGAHTVSSPVTNNIVSTSLIAEVQGSVAKDVLGEETIEISPAPALPPAALAKKPEPKIPPPVALNSSAFEPKIRFFSSLQPEPEKAFSSAPKISSRAALVKELTYESLIFEKNLSQRWPLASITKLMTALVALDRFKQDEKIVISERAIQTEGQSGGFRAGEVFTALDLIKALLVVSSNDAATALEEHIGVRNFLELMRSYAFDLGLNQTTFTDSPGLSVLSQSTLVDLAKLSEYVFDTWPIIFEISTLKATTITELVSRTTRVLKNNNKFAGSYDFIGGKTGYTEEAQGNLLSIFRHKDYLFLIIVFGSADRFEDTQNLYAWAKSNY